MSDSNDCFDHVTVIKKANVYGQECVSHTLKFPDGSRKSVGVIFPATLSFTTGAAEIMETVAGSCRYRLPDSDWQTAGPGESFAIPAETRFDIEVAGEPYHYVCHFES